MKRFIGFFAVVFLAGAAGAAEFGVSAFDRAGNISWSNAFPGGVATIETANVVTGRWTAVHNLFTSNSVGHAVLALPPSNTFVRVLAVDLSTNTPRHYTNLTESYGILETVAGKGQFNGDMINYWQASFEGGWATNANLSRPHIAFGHPHGNVIIVDQGSSAVLKVTPEG